MIKTRISHHPKVWVSRSSTEPFKAGFGAQHSALGSDLTGMLAEALF